MSDASWSLLLVIDTISTKEDRIRMNEYESRYLIVCTHHVSGKTLMMSVPDYGYLWNASWVMHYISTFVLLPLCRYLCWWTINVRGYHLPSGQFLNNVIICKAKVLPSDQGLRTETGRFENRIMFLGGATCITA